MNIAFIGYGQVGAPLADHLRRLGHGVTLAAKDPSSENVRKALALNPDLAVAAPAQAVSGADVVFLATPYAANEAAVTPLAGELAGKVLVDCTNPVGEGLRHGLGSVTSGSETLQALLPRTRVVKAFTIYGFENLIDNCFPESPVPPAMFFCGGDEDAKRTVSDLIEALGWEPFDVGGLEQALHLEHMTLLWIRLVRVYGHSPHLTWSVLEG